MRGAVAAAILWMFVTLAVEAANTGRVRLAIQDVNGDAVAGATVDLNAVDRPGRRQISTDSRGEVTFGSIVPGLCEATVTLEGFSTSVVRIEVRQNETATAIVVMQVTPVADEMTVTIPAPVVATGTSVVSGYVTPEYAEPIPVGRDYVSWTQLVPGVSAVPNGGGAKPPFDPSAKGGNSYNDRGGNPGSRDNVYLLEGFPITDIAGGTGSLELNHEVVLEQQVITSGSTAEFAGAKGFVTNVVTRSGSNQFHASANLFMQDAGWVGSRRSDDPRHAIAPDDQYDWAVTFGGPIRRDSISFFLSAQQRDASADVTLTELASPVPITTQSSFTRTNVFGKATVAPDVRQSLGILFYRDERMSKGSRSPNTPINRYGRSEDVPSLLALDYTRVGAKASLFTLTGGILDRSSGGIPEYPELGPANTLLFEPGTMAPPYERFFGSSGGESTQEQQRINVSPSFSTVVEKGGSHLVRGGIQFYQWYEENWSRQLDGHSFSSFAPLYSGITFADAVARGFFPQGEFDYILRSLQESPGSAAFAAVDRNGDGIITADELGAVAFASRAGNRDGVNFLRTSDEQVGVNRVKSINWSAFLQDDWTRGRLNLQYGLRVDDWRYVASDGSTIVDMDPVFSPRVGASWDVLGDGRHSVSAFYGRYYDPLLTPIVRFAGNLSGTVLAEQIFLGEDWFTYRVRGSATRRDAVFAPNLRNQRQDEYALTWSSNLSTTFGFVAQAWHRREGNLIEDYDPVYFNRDVAGDLALDPVQFGFGPEGPVGANYFVANLVGGKRDAWGLDLGIERRFSGTWGGSFHYSWKRAKGNTNSDANTDLQGDFLHLDPRLPYMYGYLPGSVEHLVKAFGSYRTPVGVQLAGFFHWSSGARYTEADIFRPETHNIIMNHRRADGTYAVTGAEKQPSYYMLDSRVSYAVGMRGIGVDLFLDVYNVFDNQDAFLVEEGYNHPDYAYRETRSLFLPRRFEAGVRFRM